MVRVRIGSEEQLVDAVKPSKSARLIRRAEHLVTSAQTADASTGGLDDPGEVVPEPAREAPAGHQLPVTAADPPIDRVGGRCPDPDQDLALAGRRYINAFKAQQLGPPYWWY
jgi:hypothetical protein